MTRHVTRLFSLSPAFTTRKLQKTKAPYEMEGDEEHAIVQDSKERNRVDK